MCQDMVTFSCSELSVPCGQHKVKSVKCQPSASFCLLFSLFVTRFQMFTVSQLCFISGSTVTLDLAALNYRHFIHHRADRLSSSVYIPMQVHSHPQSLTLTVTLSGDNCYRLK